MTFKPSVLVPDALVAMESNLKAILAMCNVRVASLECRVDADTGTASITHHQTPNGLLIRVFFPALKTTHRLTKQELDRWTGYFIHEICHALHTDEMAWIKACRAGLNALVNGMEDVRIERKMIRSATVDNAKERLVELLDYVANRPAPKGAQEYNPNDMRSLPWTLAIIGRVKLNGYAIQAGHKAYAKLNPAMRRLVDSALAKLDKAKNTTDVLAIAEWIQATSAKPQAPVNSRPGEGEGKESGAGEPSEGAGKPSKPKGADEGEDKPKGAGEAPKGADEGEGEGEGEESGAGAGEPDKGEGEESGAGEGKGEGEGDNEGDNGAGEGEGEGEDSSGQQGADGHGAPKPFDARKMEDVNLNPTSDEVLKASAKVLKDGDAPSESVMATILRDAINKASQPLNAGDSYGGSHGYARLAQEAQKASAMRQQCARVLKRSDKDSWQRRLSAGRIDRRAYGRIASGDLANPFAKHTFSPGYETEITILLDGSDSMNQGQKLYRATALAIVVAQAAEQVGVKSEIVRFYGGRVLSLKAPRERLASQAVQARLTVASKSTRGSTPLTQSLALCAKRLFVRAPTKRKMIFAITDGVCDCGSQTVRRVADHCDGAGVEVIGLSIDSGTHDAFRFEARVDSSDDVSKAGLGVLVKALENRPGFATSAR